MFIAVMPKMCIRDSSSDIKQVFFKKVHEIYTETGNFMPPQVFNPSIQEVKKTVLKKMELFGSVGKAALY